MQHSGERSGFDPSKLKTFYILFGDATTAVCLNGRSWHTMGAELIECGPLNSFVFRYEGDEPIQRYLDQACNFAAFTPEFISEALS